MPEPQAFRQFAETVLRWRDLVERRCAHLVELQSSGRWRRYYSETKLEELLLEGLDLVETWSALVPRSESANPPGLESAKEGAPSPAEPLRQRTAA